MSRALDQRLRELRDRYRATLDAKLVELEGALRAAVQSGAPDDCERLWTVAHNLAGTAGSHGFAELAEVVREMETLVAPFRRLGDLPVPVSDGLVLLFQEGQRLARA